MNDKKRRGWRRVGVKFKVKSLKFKVKEDQYERELDSVQQSPARKKKTWRNSQIRQVIKKNLDSIWKGHQVTKRIFFLQNFIFLGYISKCGSPVRKFGGSEGLIV